MNWECKYFLLHSLDNTIYLSANTMFIFIMWHKWMPVVILVVGHPESSERHIWTGGESSDFLSVKAMHREGNCMLWINSVSCCYFFFSWILFPINTISWRNSGLLLLARLGIFYSISVQQFLSRGLNYTICPVLLHFFPQDNTMQ